MEQVRVKCKYCGKETNKGGLATHIKYCKLNPDRVKRQSFTIGISSKGNQPKELKECEFCNRKWMTTLSGYWHHKTYCKCNPDRVAYKGHAHTEEQKRKISESMKKAHAEGRAGHWIRRVSEPSRPEQFLIEVLKNELQMEENKDYKREVYYNGYFLDFCWEERKLVIEMDGEQHQTLQKQVERDSKKDALLKADGYKELRIPWKDCFHEPKVWIEKVKAFLK